MIFALSIVIKFLRLPTGQAGAWIGTSEFADATGITASSSFSDKALTTFTVMKVVGRDMFIGIWCFVLSLIAITKWEKREDGTKTNVFEIWTRFRKFVLVFLIVNIILGFLLSTQILDSYWSNL